MVDEHGLISNEVNLDCVKLLIGLDKTSELKLAPHLKESCVEPGHYEKMKVGLAFSLFNIDTAAAIRLLVEKNQMSKDALTTAWFIETIFKWFRLMTSRTTKLALSRFDSNKYDESLTFLRDTIELFATLSIGNAVKQVWKPIQTGVILATTSALELQDHLLNEKGFLFVLLSRLSQDALENLFSTLKSKNPVPRPCDFKCAIRAATMSQFLRPSKDGSYAEDSGFLLTGLQQKECSAESVEEIEPNVPEEMLDLTGPEQESLEYLAGFVVKSVIDRFSLCTDCVGAICSCGPANRLTQLKSYNKENIRLVVPSTSVMLLLEQAEAYFRRNEQQLLSNSVCLDSLRTHILGSLSFSNCFPECHDVQTKLVRVFLKTRLCIFLKKENSERLKKMKANLKCGSRSVGMRAAATNVK